MKKISPGSTQESTQTTTPAQNPPADPLDAIAKELLKRMGLVPADAQLDKLPRASVPVEDVEAVGEKIN